MDAIMKIMASKGTSAALTPSERLDKTDNNLKNKKKRTEKGKRTSF